MKRFNLHVIGVVVVVQDQVAHLPWRFYGLAGVTQKVVDHDADSPVAAGVTTSERVVVVDVDFIGRHNAGRHILIKILN
jgi:hypothetical protein